MSVVSATNPNTVVAAAPIGSPFTLHRKRQRHQYREVGLDEHQTKADTASQRPAEFHLPPAKEEEPADEEAIVSGPDVHQRGRRQHHEPGRSDALWPPWLRRPDEEGRPTACQANSASGYGG